MKLYIITVMGAALMSAVINIISPEKWTKYVSIVTGLVIAVSIGRPVFYIMHRDIFSDITFTEQASAADGEAYFYSELKAEMEKRIEEDIRTRLKTEFGADCTVSAEILSDRDGRILGVKKIMLGGGHIDGVAIGRLREIYGAEEVIGIGPEKDTSKEE